ncbi:MAG: hypothetical protein AAF734_07215, partial [Bacteroidota bacterium]
MEALELQFLEQALHVLLAEYPLIISWALLLWTGRRYLVRGSLYLIRHFLKHRGEHIAKTIQNHNHPFFSYMEKCEKIIIPNILMQSAQKTHILRTFLRLQFETFRVNVYQLVNQNKLDQLHPFDFQAEVLKAFDHSVEEYQKKARAQFEEMGIETTDIDYILRLFDQHHQGTLQLVRDAIKEACLSPFLS